ncbi:MAG: DivIVA domain-containing protein, partial [Ilumatobacteraceae bacterium]
AFGTARRGFDQQEVRDFLRMVAAELARLQERERFLERELRAAQANALPPDGIDDEMATRLLGEEAARILQTAREGAAAIRNKAEDGAAQLLRDAAGEAQRVREEADLEASRRRSEAARDADSELGSAKQQGREMVDEARAYRERVLGELSRRRELAREQIEQLLHGRDRLLDAFERARLAAVDVVAEITPLGEPEEYVDLSPTTGPVPITRHRSAIGDASAIDDRALIVDAPAAVEPEPELVDAADLDRDPLEHVECEPVDHGGVEMFDREDDPDPEPVVPVGPPAPDAPDLAAEATVLNFPTPSADVPPDDDEIDDDDVTATDIDDLFARLRSTDPDELVEELETEELEDLVDTVLVEIDAEPLPDEPDTGRDDGADRSDAAETPFRRRDAALVPLIVASARKLKRVLADEQNEVLDALRSSVSVASLDQLVTGADEQADRYVAAVAADLAAAVAAGAASVPPELAVAGAPMGVPGPVRDLLVAELVAPLRERLERSVTDGDGDNDAIAKRARGVYREWKTQRIDEQLDDLFRLAYCEGIGAAVPPSSLVTWEVDPDGPPSPDCEDNALAGPVAIGEPFPSGHRTPPMHPGCRCLLVALHE